MASGIRGSASGPSNASPDPARAPRQAALEARSRPGCDLDNFVTPVVKALGGSKAFAVVLASRGRSDERARLTLSQAADFQVHLQAADHVVVRLAGSAERPGWKEAIAAAIGEHTCADGDGPIELGIRFRVSPDRNWATLWKPAIDALGGILGDSHRPWQPHDDRISLLALERELASDLGWDVELDVSWVAR
jgi:hypothetical protein